MNTKSKQLKRVLGSAFTAGALLSSPVMAKETGWTQFGDIPIAVYGAKDTSEASCAAKKSEHACAAKKTEQSCAAKKTEQSCAAKKSEQSCAAKKTEQSCAAHKS